MSKYIITCIFKNHTVYSKHASIMYSKSLTCGKGLSYIKDMRHTVLTDIELETK